MRGAQIEILRHPDAHLPARLVEESSGAVPEGEEGARLGIHVACVEQPCLLVIIDRSRRHPCVEHGYEQTPFDDKGSSGDGRCPIS